MTAEQTPPKEAAPDTGRQPSNPPDPRKPSPSRKWRTAIIGIGIALFAIGCGFAIWRFVRVPDIPKNVVALSGRIEGDDSAIASKSGGRILAIYFREGDRVNQDDVIATLADDQIEARQTQAQAVVQQAQARVSSAEEQIAVLAQQLVQSRLQAVQSGEDAKGRVGQATADVAATESDLAQQVANLQLAEFDRDAYTRLAKSGAVSERQGKEASSKADAQAAAVTASRRRVEASRGALTLAQSTLANPAIRNSQSTAVERQIVQQKSEVASAKFQSSQAQAQLLEAQANRQDQTVRAPFAGTIVSRTAEPGEVIAAGATVVTMLDLTKVYLRGFIAEGQIGKVRVGQAARVYLDSDNNKPLEAYVARIDPAATFTPENTYFRDDRVKQVVGVKLQLKSSTGFAKPGMPSDGEILIDGDRWPARSVKQ